MQAILGTGPKKPRAQAQAEFERGSKETDPEPWPGWADELDTEDEAMVLVEISKMDIDESKVQETLATIGKKREEKGKGRGRGKGKWQEKKDLKQAFEAVITDIKNHGLYIEITDSMAFGMVHISTLDDDFYHPSNDGKKLTGRKTGKVYAVADTIQVQVERVDRFKRQIDFRIVREDERPQKGRGKGKYTKKTTK